MKNKFNDNQKIKTTLNCLNRTITHLDNVDYNSDSKGSKLNRQFYKTLQNSYKPQSPKKGMRNKSQTRYSQIIQKNKKQKYISQDLNVIRYNSISFRPTFEPRRTFGNLKYLLEVMHKKIRAKNIQAVFEQSIYALDENREHKKGLKGRKLSRHSNFINPYYNKPSAFQMPNHTENKILKGDEQQLNDQSFKRYNQLCKQEQQTREVKQIIQMNASFKTNANYHQLKKNYRKIAEQKSIKHMQKDIYNFGMNIKVKSINFNT